MNSIYNKELLTRQDIQEEVFRRVKKYEGKTFFECFAIYLGTTQILESSLKKVLEEKFHVQPEKIEKCTLGQTRKKLEAHGTRKDYTELLEAVVIDRNHAAHELLANQALISNIGVNISEHAKFKDLKDQVFRLEQAIFLYDYIQHNNAWVTSE